MHSLRSLALLLLATCIGSLTARADLVTPPSIDYVNYPTSCNVGDTVTVAVGAHANESDNSDGNDWNGSRLVIARVMIDYAAPGGDWVKVYEWLPTWQSPANVAGSFVASTPGTWTIRVRVMDGRPWYTPGGDYDYYTFQVVSPTPVIQSPLSVSLNQGQNVSYTISATNSPTSFAASNLPAGLSLNASTGQITGRVTAAGTIASTISASNGAGTDTRTLTWSITPAVIQPQATVSPTTLAFGQTVTLTRAGTMNFGFGWTENVIWRPDGQAVVLGNQPLGTQSYRPVMAGNHTYQFRLVDAYQNFVDQGIGFTVTKATPSAGFGNRTYTPAASGIYTVAAADLNATFSNPYTQNATQPTGPVTYTLVGSGATVAAGTQLAAGTAYTVRASYAGDANYNATTADAVFTIATLAPVVTSGGTWRVPQGAVVRPYRITASNSPTSFGASGLPAGLSVNAADGSITGTPTQAGVFNATVTASNSAGTGSQALSLTVSATDLLPNASVSPTLVGPGQAVTLTRAGTAYLGVGWTENVIWRPNGTAENLGNAGLGTSTYTPSGGDGTYTYQFRFVDTQENFKDQILTFVVDSQPPSVPSGLGAAGIGTTSFTLSWTASTDNVAVSVYEVKRDSTVLGTTSSPSYSVTGLSAATTYAMAVRARDTAGNWSAWSTPVNVTTATAPPTITSAASASSAFGAAFSYTITATGNPTSYSVTGALPTGLSLNATTGAITGAPQQPGTFNVVIGATNAAGTGTASLQITVAPPATELTISPTAPVIIPTNQLTTFHVVASHASGLSEIGIEVRDAAGVPISNAGGNAATGYYHTQDFTWSAATDGLYYIGAYMWNAARTDLRRSATTLVVVGAPPAQLTLGPTTPRAVAPGEPVTFDITASHPGSLNEIGLELYDSTASTPVSNAGALTVNGPYVQRTITWSTTTPGVYYFGAYAWNASHNDLRRTGTTTVIVGSPPGGVILSPNSPIAVQAGDVVTFAVTGHHPGGLSEIGLEITDAQGTPTSNQGSYPAAGVYARREIPWSTTTPGVYYFDGYIWNADRTELLRTVHTPVIVGSPAPTAALMTPTKQVPVGATVNITVFGYQPSGLGEIGLERTSAAGTPTSNEGNVMAGGVYGTHTFTWTAPANGVYYFDGYAWNAARTDLQRSQLLAITVGAGNPPNQPDPDPTGPGMPTDWPNHAGTNNGKAVGGTVGELSVDKNGAANYSVPLWVSPGTAGMEPKLALGYSSQGGSGLLGHGWSLSGASAITRGPRTRAVDGYIHGVDLTNQDAFYLDGQRLIPIVGDNGSSTTEYRTEIDSFTRIVSYGVTGSGPEWFRVWTKSGLISEYGHTPDSNFNPGNGTALSWAVNRISDTRGNYIAFEYDESTAGGWQRLREIKYTGNSVTGLQPYASVKFGYENRSDTTQGYRAGVYLSNDVRLKSIESWVGAQRARSYVLDYEERGVSQRSVLKALREIGRDGGEFPPLTFDYDTSTGGWESTPAYAPPYPLGYSANNKQTGAGFVDLNGDGRVDFVHSLDGVGSAYLNNGSGWAQAPQFTPPLNLASSTGADTSARFVDLNGDGLPDFIWRHHRADGSLNVSGVRLNNGNGWSQTQLWAPPCPLARDSFPNHSARFLDLNGDGRIDLVAPLGGMYLNTGSGWQLNSNYTNVGYDWAYYKGRFVDLNGDGLPDLVVSFNGNGETRNNVWLNNGNGWTPANNYILPALIADDQNPSLGAEFVDVNADGLVDFIWYREGGTGDRGLAINTGTGWSIQNDGSLFATLRSPFPLSRDGTSSPGTSFTDVNADGYVDMVMRRVFSGVRSTATNLGTGRGWPGEPSGSPFYLPVDLFVSGQSSQGVDFVDFDGDGVADIVRREDDVAEAYRNLAKPADRLVKVTSAFGVSAYIQYSPLTAGSVYTKGTGSTFPVSDVIAPMQVVSRVEHDDGVGGRYGVTYTYGDLRSHAERGSLGFGWTRTRDERNGLQSTTWFRQDYPFIGMPRASETRKSDGGLLSESSLTYAERVLNQGKTRFAFASQSTARSYELNGALTSETVTTTECDDWGNATRVAVNTSDGFEKITTSTYDNLIGPAYEIGFDGWLLGRLTNSSVESRAPNVPTQVRTSRFTYQAGSGLLESETIEPDNAALKLTTTYGYDSYGNKTSSRLSAPGEADRVASTQYDGQGRFPVSSTNALAHSESYSYDSLWGAVAAETGPNQLTTTWTFDQFGRVVLEHRPDGTETTTRTCWPHPGNGFPGGTAYFVETIATGAPPAVSAFDAMGRVVASYAVNGGGTDHQARTVVQETEYDSMGRAYRTALPHFKSVAVSQWVQTTAFDVLNRPLSIVTPDDEVAGGAVSSSVSYQGLTTETTDALGHVERVVKNTQGQVVRRVNNAGAPAGSSERGEVAYTYDAYGNLLTTAVHRENGTTVTTSLQYDGRGRKTRMIDPDMGTWDYQYNAFGELTWQRDAKGQVVTMQYDALGRLVARSEPEGTTNWNYDTAPRSGGTWLGRLHTVTGPTDRGRSYGEAYAYDELGRPSGVTRTIDGVGYTTNQSYDSSSRPLVTTYPSGFKVRNVYSPVGLLYEIREANLGSGLTGFTGEVTPDKLFWRADSFSVTGKVDGSTLGNGVTYDCVISPVTGRVRAITAGLGAGTAIQFHNYTYDALGQVTRKVDGATGRDERFGYDGLNRLQTHTVVGGAIVSMGYDALGNITGKSDVGAYTYAGTAPHAVTQAGANNYGYDANGNMTAGAGRTLEWTSFNQVRKITQGGLATEFWFGAGHERVVQQHTNGTKTIYAGSNYEVVQGGGLTEYKHYIVTPLGRTAVRTVRSDARVETRYFHQDALGSIYAVTDEFGAVEKRFVFDAWGKRVNTVDNRPSSGGAVTRGFTDHEHLTDFGLIHMNGRVYDPVLGRFLSADPFVDDAGNSQAYNRYSYLSNNPLGGSDPSGYFSVKDGVKVVAALVVAYFTAGLATPLLSGAFASVGTAVGMSASVAASWGAAVAGGVGFGFGSSFATSLLNGGSIGDAFKAGAIGALRGAISAGLAYGVGHGLFGDEIGSFANEAGRALAHGILQGGVEEAFGGSFQSGFIGGVIGSAVGSGLKGSGIHNRFVSMIVAAVAGGTAAELGGGKFANGALSAAFTDMFNHYGNDVFDAGSGVAMGILEGFTVSYNADVSTGNANMDAGRTVGRWIGRVAQFVNVAKGAITLGRALGSRLTGRMAVNVAENASAAEAAIQQAASTVGIDLAQVSIKGGVARGTITLSEKLLPADINALKAVLKARGATSAQIESGFIGNPKLEAFLTRFAESGRKFYGATVRKSMSNGSDFLLTFENL